MVDDKDKKQETEKTTADNVGKQQSEDLAKKLETLNPTEVHIGFNKQEEEKNK